MQDPADDKTISHASLMDKRFLTQPKENIESVMREMKMLKILLSAILGAVLGALAYFLLM